MPSSGMLHRVALVGTEGFEGKSVPTKVTRCKIPEYGIFHSHRLENLKSYSQLYATATANTIDMHRYNLFFSYHVLSSTMIQTGSHEFET
jgi:hypothetical protein